MTRHFTGWHMTTILVAFFGIVIAVNLIMARYAIGTFGGTVVDNSYVASQKYNRWLDEAARQEKLGWTPKVNIDSNRQIVVSVMENGTQLSGVTGDGWAIHPLGRAPNKRLTFTTSPSGVLRSVQSLPSGRWSVQLALRRGSDTVKLSTPVK